MSCYTINSFKIFISPFNTFCVIMMEFRAINKSFIIYEFTLKSRRADL